MNTAPLSCLEGTSSLQSFWLLQFFHVWCSLSLKCKGCVIDEPVGILNHIVTYSLHFEHLWIFIVVPSVAKRSFIDEDKYLQRTWQSYWLGNWQWLTRVIRSLQSQVLDGFRIVMSMIFLLLGRIEVQLDSCWLPRSQSTIITPLRIPYWAGPCGSESLWLGMTAHYIFPLAACLARFNTTGKSSGRSF